MAKATTKTASVDFHSVNRLTFLTLTTLGVYILLANYAFAQGSPMGEVLCSAVAMIMGDLGRGLATLAVIAVGIGALIGKASWGMALTVATGIAVVFGAPGIVMALGVADGGCSAGSGGGLSQYYSGYYASVGANNQFGSNAGINCSGMSGSQQAQCNAANGVNTVNTYINGATSAANGVGALSNALGNLR